MAQPKVKSSSRQSKADAKPSTPRKPKRATKEAIQAALARLDASYALGNKLKGMKPINAKAMRALAKKHPVGKSYSNLCKMRQLAKLVPSDADWKTLRSIRMKQSGLPLSWTNVVALVSLSSWDKLLETAKLAALESWSAAETRRHIQRASGGLNRRPGTGRSVRKVKDLTSGLQKLRLDLQVVQKRVATLRALQTGMTQQTAVSDKLVALDVAIKAIVAECDSPTTAVELCAGVP